MLITQRTPTQQQAQADAIIELFTTSPAPPEEVVAARTRTVLLYEGVVIKIPTCDEGVRANSREFHEYSCGDGIPVAPVTLVPIDGVVVSVMERVSPHPNAFSDPGMPWWVGCVDCGQVGYRATGELVAYDL
ncbi:Uncharacterised protein [Mycobacteroides abscessus subsp. abscessus]|uniref:hypothetical protein n=1 Tax=Mycobacteroides abscessus TaxID=36809 RepID=UPI00092A901B|nr:hypothetical protein [Mycobacteroides abscessus]SIH36574.1 Uncharacterised protein [Mycobacteroides abscessus subsp. abscessus]